MHSSPQKQPIFFNNSTAWVEKIVSKLSLEEKIGQLLHVAAYSNRDQAHLDFLHEQVEKHKIGGLIFFQGTPKKQKDITQQLQSVANTPLLISMDAEWGLGMRLDNTMNFPYQMALGALPSEDHELIHEMGREIGRQLRLLGVHINFAPVVDINNNPANPVIGFRSFSEDKYKVVGKTTAYMQGLHEARVLACAKHFPGHGDTATDSHFALPKLPHERERLETTEFFPYHELIERGLGLVMSAHLNVPSLDPSGLPSTLSKVIIDHELKKEMGFRGLVFTDALDMKGVTSVFSKPGDVAARALLAGNDVLLFVTDVPKAISAILKEVNKGAITEEEITERCRKQLMAKAWVGLTELDNEPNEKLSLKSELHTARAERLNLQMAQQFVTLIKNEKQLLPFTPPDVKNIGVVSIKSKLVEQGETLAHHTLNKGIEEKEKGKTIFQKEIQHFLPDTSLLFIDKSTEVKEFETFISKRDIAIVGVHLTRMKASDNFGLVDWFEEALKPLESHPQVVACLFGNIYALDRLEMLQKSTNALLLAYQDAPFTQKAAAQILFGQYAPQGKLPVTINESFPFGMGLRW